MKFFLIAPGHAAILELEKDDIYELRATHNKLFITLSWQNWENLAHEVRGEKREEE